MRAYSANILPTDATYYTLSDATLSNGILTIQPNGYARTVINATNIATLPEYFRVSALASPSSDNYELEVYMHIRVKSSTNKYFDHYCNLSADAGIVSNAEIELINEDYSSFEVTIGSSKQCTLTLWELCPASSGDIEVIIDGVKQSLPKLLYDYNTGPISFTQREVTISRITCKLMQNTDLQGHFLLTYTASQATTLTLRFKDNDSTELFAPLLYDVIAGRGTIGVPHAYLNRLAGFHSFIVTAQASVGTITIGTRDLQFSVDGGYLAERTIDMSNDTCDFALEQGLNDSKPSYLWAMGISVGELLVRRCANPSELAGRSFEPMFSLGPAKDGAMEFDGEWALISEYNDLTYRLVTYPTPYCFFIDNDDNLYRQQGSNIASKTLIDTNVTAVSACRGYKSLYYPEQDQGLIVLYIKNSRAWYVQYMYDSTTQDYLWTAPIQVTEVNATVKHVSVHRLNDYRVGFCITTTDTNYWLISTRTYVGQAFKPEIVDMSGRVDTLVSYFKASDLPAAVTCTGDLSEDRLTITGTFNYPVRCTASNIMDGLSMATQLSSTIDTITLEGQVLTITLNTPVRAPYDITIVAWPYWQYQFQNQWTRMNNNITFTYDPYGELTTPTAETVQFATTLTSITSQMRPIVTQTPDTQEDTATFDVTSITPTIVQRAVSEVPHNAEDTAAFTVASITATVQLLLVGTEPI